MNFFPCLVSHTNNRSEHETKPVTGSAVALMFIITQSYTRKTEVHGGLITCSRSQGDGADMGTQAFGPQGPHFN